MKDSLATVRGLKLERHIPVIANEVPHLMITWDEATLKLTSQDVVKKLLEGEPSIAVLRQGAGNLLVSVWMMRDEEHRMVARRVREIFA